MTFYRLLRDNKELGPYTLEELRRAGLKSTDLIWIDGESASWRFPDEIPALISLYNTHKEGGPSPAPSFKEQQILGKKRYRLTADHRLVEITDDDPAAEALPRIASQPPAPHETSPGTHTPFAAKAMPQPETSPDSANTAARAMDNEPLQIDPDSPSQPFTPVSEEKKPMQKKKKNSGSSTGAFVFAGLLFLIAIAFFGFRWYKEQNAPDNANPDEGLMTDTVPDGQSPVMNGGAIGAADDTAGQMERIRSQQAIRDSLEAIRQQRLADAAAQAHKDSMAAANDPTLAPVDAATPAPDAAAAKPGDFSAPKTASADEIGKYIRIGVVHPAAGQGIKGMKLVVHNLNNRNIARVRLNIIYYDANGAILQRGSIVAPNIGVGKSVTMPVPYHANAATVSYKIAGVLGDHLNLKSE